MAFGKTNAPTGEKNRIERISVNGTEIEPINQKVDIPIPENTDTNTTYTLTKSGNTITLHGSDGSKSSVTDSDTVYSTMKGASASTAGTAGLVPAPAKGTATRYLRSDGTWHIPPDTNTTYDTATQSTAGLMSAEDKAKLDSIPAGGMSAYVGKITIDSSASNSPFKIKTSSRPKFIQMYYTGYGTDFNGGSIRCYTESGSYYLSGNSYAHITFEDDGITISWAADSGIGSFSHQYIVFC